MITGLAKLLSMFSALNSRRLDTCATQHTRGIHPMLFQCWPTVFDAGPTLKQHWVNASCLLGIYYFIHSFIQSSNTRTTMSIIQLEEDMINIFLSDETQMNSGSQKALICTYWSSHYTTPSKHARY